MKEILSAIVYESAIFEHYTTDDMITSAAEQISRGFRKAIAGGLIDTNEVGFNLNSMISDLGKPLEFCYSTFDTTKSWDL